jgi:hypothetical protein
LVAASAPENVEVEFVPSTLINPCMVDVPAVSPCKVVVEVPPTLSVVSAARALPRNVPDKNMFPEDVMRLAELKNCRSPVAPLP